MGSVFHNVTFALKIRYEVPNKLAHTGQTILAAWVINRRLFKEEECQSVLSCSYITQLDYHESIVLAESIQKL